MRRSLPTPPARGGLLLGLLLALVASGCAREQTRPRGVLLVVVDCLRADFVGAAGAQFPATPSIDALASEGTLFASAYAQAGWTRPSLHTLLTGLYPSEHGIKDILDKSDPERPKGKRLPDDAVTLPERFRAAGFRTALIGNQVQLDPSFGLDQGFDDYQFREGDTSEISARFLRWLEERGDGPFFAYLHFLELHFPYCPTRALGSFGSGDESRDFCQAGRSFQAQIRRGEVELSAPDQRAFRARYAEELLEVDQGIGALFAELRKRGLWNELLVVLTSDHGEEFFEHGGAGHGHSLYDELLHVPFIWKLPGSWRAPSGRRVDRLVETRTLTPTLADLLVLGANDGPGAESLAPWLLGRRDGTQDDSYVVSETIGAVALRTADWKLIYRPDGESVRLFDLRRDPGELADLSGSEPAARAEMLGRLRRWQAGLRPLKPGSTAMDEETLRGLRSLGYLEPGAGSNP